MFFLGRFGMAMRRLRNNLVDYIIPLMFILYHFINGTPVGQTANVAIVDKHIYLELT